MALPRSGDSLHCFDRIKPCEFGTQEEFAGRGLRFSRGAALVRGVYRLKCETGLKCETAQSSSWVTHLACGQGRTRVSRMIMKARKGVLHSLECMAVPFRTGG